MDYQQALAYLELDDGYDKTTLDKAFRRRSLVLHPDKNRGNPARIVKCE